MSRHLLLQARSRASTLRGAAAVAVTAALLVAIPAFRADAEVQEPATGGCHPAWSLSHESAGLASYNGVAAVGSDAWVAGTAGAPRSSEGIAASWDGSTWTDMEVPGEAQFDQLRAVDGVIRDDVWGVGTQIVHWNGERWAMAVELEGSVLEDVEAVARDDVWAVGRTSSGGADRTLVMHFDGTTWSAIDSPNEGSGANALYGVAVTSPNDVWAVGSHRADGVERTLILHWDGQDWSLAASPDAGSGDNHLAGAAAAGGRAWATGWYVADGAYRPLVLSFADGTWKVEGSLPATQPNAFLHGVAAASFGDVWAVGWEEPAGGGYPQQSVIMHFDGASWARATSPNPDASTTRLLGVATDSKGRAWAAGDAGVSGIVMEICPTRVTRAGFVPSSTTVPAGRTTAWRLPVGQGAHSVTDATGLALFDSGRLTAGRSFTFTFFGAGTYAIRDDVTGATTDLGVRMRIDPLTGTEETQFRVVWASEPAPVGFVFDIQGMTPASGEWASWRTGQTRAKARMRPRVGPGTYSFRARVRNTATGAASGWSPPVSIEVS